MKSSFRKALHELCPFFLIAPQARYALLTQVRRQWWNTPKPCLPVVPLDNFVQDILFIQRHAVEPWVTVPRIV